MNLNLTAPSVNLTPSSSPSTALSLQAIEQGILLLQTAVPKLTIPPTTAHLWAKLLGDLTPAQFEHGLTTFLRDNAEIYPTTNIPATIRRLAKGNRDVRAEALLIYHGHDPDGMDTQAAAQARTITHRMSTGLTADARWDEQRFVDLYVGLVGHTP